MKTLGIVTLALCLLAVPAVVALVATARGYLDTTADIAALRIEIVDLVPSADTARSYPGPDITLRVFGVAQTALTFEEVNFDLLWQGQRVATVAAFPRLSIPRGGSLTVKVFSNLAPAYADATRALLDTGERRFLIQGNARIGLPNSATSVWLALNGQVRAGGPAAQYAMAQALPVCCAPRPIRDRSFYIPRFAWGA